MVDHYASGIEWNDFGIIKAKATIAMGNNDDGSLSIVNFYRSQFFDLLSFNMAY